MFGRLFLLFVLVPLVELALLIRIGQAIGLLPTIAIVVVTGALGAALARSQGVRAVRTMQTEIARGAAPGDSILDGVAVLIGAVLLLTPGILTDVAGLCLLLPWTRNRIKAGIRARIEQGIRDGTTQVSFVSFGPGGMRGPGGAAGPGGRTEGSDEVEGGGRGPASGGTQGRPGEVGRARVITDED